jgi:hypothetical protein
VVFLRKGIQIVCSLIAFYLLVVLIQLMGIVADPYNSGYWYLVLFVLLFIVFMVSIVILYDYYKDNQLERVLIFFVVLFNTNYFVQGFFMEVVRPVVDIFATTIDLTLMFKTMHLSSVYLTELNLFLRTPMIMNVIVLVIMVAAPFVRTKLVK